MTGWENGRSREKGGSRASHRFSAWGGGDAVEEEGSEAGLRSRGGGDNPFHFQCALRMGLQSNWRDRWAMGTQVWSSGRGKMGRAASCGNA